MPIFDFFKPLSSVKTYTYNVWSYRDLTDPYAKPVMRDFFPEEYERTKEWTKRGASNEEAMKIFDSGRGKGQNDTMVMDSDEQFFLDLACKRVRSMLGSWKVEPWSLDRAIDNLHTDTSAGYGYPGKKKGEVLEEIRAEAKDMMYHAIDHRPQVPKPALLGTRGVSIKRDSPKRRIIYNVPGAQVALGQIFYGPLTEKAKSIPNYPIAVGKNTIPKLAEKNAQVRYPKGSYKIKIDCQHFDRNLMTFLIIRACGITADMIDFTHWKGKLLNDSQEMRWRRLWEYCVEYTTHTPIMKPDGTLAWQDGEICSGEPGTQWLESIISLIMVTYWTLLAGVHMYDVSALGDDCDPTVHGYPDLNHLVRTYYRTFHAVVNLKKTEIINAAKDGGSFLGYNFRNGFLIRESDEWFRMMLYCEHPVKDLATSFSRLTAYMFLGGINDVRFTDFFTKYQQCWPLENWDFVMTRDMKAKMMYGGQTFVSKKLLENTANDFLYALITFK